MITEYQKGPTETFSFFEVDPDANVLPLDPVLGERLRPGQVPESLLTDPELRKGYDYFRNNGSRIHAKILLSRHDTSEDLASAGIDLAAEARELAEHGGVLFLEGVYASNEEKRKGKDGLNTVSHLASEHVDLMQQALRASQTGSSFQLESMAQIAGSGVDVACPDYVSGSDQQVDNVLANWKKQLRSIEQSAQLSPSDIDKYTSLLMGFTIYRDWYMIGKMGAYLADKSEHSGSEADDEVYMKLLVGSTHVTIGRHIEGFGGMVEYAGETEDKLSRQNTRIVHAVGTATLSQTVRVQQLADALRLTEK